MVTSRLEAWRQVYTVGMPDMTWSQCRTVYLWYHFNYSRRTVFYESVFCTRLDDVIAVPPVSTVMPPSGVMDQVKGQVLKG